MSRHPRAGEDTEQGFVKRWSRRKARGDQPDAAPEPGPADEARPQPEAGGAGEGGTIRGPESRSDPAGEVKTDRDMPDLESINETSDVSDFLSPGVSEALRNQALRRLFRSARFNVIDPLDDYNEDYRSFQALGDLVTSDMRHRMELEKEQAEERAELASDAETPAADTGEEQDDAEGGEQAESGLAAADRDDDRGAGTATEDGRTPESDDSSPSRS